MSNLDDSCQPRIERPGFRMPPNMTAGNKAIFIGVNRLSRFTTGVAILAQMFIAIGRGSTAFADNDRATLIKRFDQLAWET